ncbi:MAG TPA: hypothetical protein VL096_11430 [Pirellulaceae bacterium]|nr:hypothetical protein [Pirellulaceae bacterium]
MSRMLATACLLTGLCLSTPVQAANPDPRESLDTMLPAMTQLLAAKKYERFLQFSISPADIHVMTGRISLPRLAKKFGESDQSLILLQSLQNAQATLPQLNLIGETAVYPIVDPATGGSTRLVFKRVGNYWYLKL